MSKIRQLDAHLTNMIAAGEVVERPAGIVKELVENSIDANASSIDVRIQEGGMQLIEISDDGYGMDYEDISSAFDRHSTSKISKAHDLNAIGTFGFRGEALPSIASVSFVEASTNNGEAGYKIIVNNGKKSQVERVARNKGTTISVKELFLKTPARLKYIKNINYENSIIQDIIHKFAMGNPHISFSLTIDDRLSFRTYGKGDMKDVFHRIYGSTVSSDVKEFCSENYDFKIEGLAAKPQHNRSNKNSIWLYINDRMIRYPKAQRAIAESYRKYMPSDRYPIVVMKIKVSPNLVDVNVHPSKWEIRLSKEQQLVELIHEHLESILNEGVSAQKFSFKPIETPIQQSIEIKEVDSIGKYFDYSKPIETPLSTNVLDISDPVSVESEEVFHDYMATETLVEESIEQYSEAGIEKETVNDLEDLTVLSQMSGKYILAQGNEGLYIIDQHAAMERVRYEYYQNKLLEKTQAMQEVLVPFVFEGRKTLVMRHQSVQDVFKPMYIDLEVFGEDAFILRSVPTWIKQKEVTEFINKVLDMIESERTVREEDLRRRVIATLACHSSVRFNEYLSMSEMVALVESLRKCDQPYHCPHGRPTLIQIGHKQLIKEFNR